MPIPILLGALAALGVGGALGAAQGMGQRKLDEQKFMREMIATTSLQGVKWPEAMIAKHVGKDAVPAFMMLPEAVQAMQKQRFSQFRQLQEGDAGPQSPQAGPPQSGTPSIAAFMPQSSGGAALTQPPPPPSEMSPGDLSTGVGENLGMPQPQATQAPAVRPVRASPSITMSAKGEMSATYAGTSRSEAQKLTEHATTQGFLSEATRGTMSYSDMVKQAGSRGILHDPNVQKAVNDLGNQQYTQELSKLAGGKVPATETEWRDLQTKAYAITGFPHPDYIKALAPTPQAQGELFASSMQRAMLANPGATFAQLYKATVAGTGITPPQPLVDTLLKEFRSNVEPNLRRDPSLANNPAAIESELQKRTGYFSVSEADRARMDLPVEDSALQGERALMGLPPLRQSQLRGQEGGAVSLPDQKKQAEQRKVAQGAAEARARAEATAAGTEGTRAFKFMTPAEREHFVDPVSLNIAPEGSKWQDVAAGGKFVSFTGTKADLSGVGRLRQVMTTYKEAIETLRPLLEEGALVTRARSLGITGGGGIKIQWADITIGRIPAGALPDKKALETAFPGVPHEQAMKYAKAMVRMQAAEDTGLSILRTFFNEKGNVRGDLIQSGIRSLPTLSDNKLTATEKYANLLDFSNTWAKGFGLPSLTGAQ